MKKLIARMAHTIPATRGTLIAVNLGGAALCIAAVIIAPHTFGALFNVFVAGFLVSNAIHCWERPGLMSTWRELERDNIQAKMQDAFVTMVRQHNDEVISRDRPKH